MKDLSGSQDIQGLRCAIPSLLSARWKERIGDLVTKDGEQSSKKPGYQHVKEHILGSGGKAVVLQHVHEAKGRGEESKQESPLKSEDIGTYGPRVEMTEKEAGRGQGAKYGVSVRSLERRSPGEKK